MAPKPSVSPCGYSTLSQLSQPTKKMTGTLPGSFLGRVTNVRSLSPRVLPTQSYKISAFSKCSLGCDCCADAEGRGDKIAKRKRAVILTSTRYLRMPGAFGEPNGHSDAQHPEA